MILACLCRFNIIWFPLTFTVESYFNAYFFILIGMGHWYMRT